MALTFGVGSSSGLTGPDQSFSTATEADIDYALDADGHTSAYNTRNSSEVVNYEVLLDAADTLPATGETDTIGENDYIIESSEKSESNTDFQRGTVSARRFTDNTIPAAV